MEIGANHHRFFTVGYQSRSVDDLLLLFERHAISQVIDVRQHAWSRKPGFSASQLSARLTQAGLGYLHRPALGSPENARRRLREDGDHAAFFEACLAYYRENPNLLDSLRDLLTGTSCCLMCFEYDVTTCHRRLLADLVEARGGLQVMHL